MPTDAIVTRITQVLVVDDDQDMLALLEGIVKTECGRDTQVVAVSNAKEAHHHLGTGRFDVLITDLEMPAVNGLELVRVAKSANAWTQSIVVTGHSSLDALTKAMAHGASDYLFKPLDISELEQSLRDILARLNRWQYLLRECRERCGMQDCFASTADDPDRA